jgi:hypothetical protein
MERLYAKQSCSESNAHVHVAPKVRVNFSHRPYHKNTSSVLIFLEGGGGVVAACLR